MLWLVEKAAALLPVQETLLHRKKLEGWDGIRVCVEIILCVFKKIFFFMDLAEYKQKEVSGMYYFHLGSLF